jgi:hypothetical protein
MVLAQVVASTVTPTDGMVIMASTSLTPGVYSLPHGLSIGANDVELNMTGVTLIGEARPGYFGLQVINAHGVRITGGAARRYFYGIRAENSADLELSEIDVSQNWVDPQSIGPNPPWLDINCAPNLTDTTNLGGGVFLSNCSAATVHAVRACDQVSYGALACCS